MGNSEAHLLLQSSNSLTSILISRFLLNLQATEQKSTGMVSSICSQVESAVFQRVIGSLGCDIEFGEDVEEDRVEGEGGGVGDVENRTPGTEPTEGRAAGEASADD